MNEKQVTAILDKHFDGIRDIPCLAGADVTRSPGTLVATISDGQWCDARSGSPLTIIGSTECGLMGWGDLDGPAYDVRAQGCAWHVSVPASLIEGMRKLGKLTATETA